MMSLKDIFLKRNLWKELCDYLSQGVLYLGVKIIGCIIIYIVGRKIICYLNQIIDKMISNRKFDPSVSSFLKSLANILSIITLLFLIASFLNINNNFFIALLASIGVTIGMTLSGTLQNFSGGVIILLFRPYKIGDYILTQGQEGTVKDIQIFNTVIVTPDNRTIFIPNGGLSSNVIVNCSRQDKRRIDWTFCVSYGSDYNKIKQVILDILATDNRIFTQPIPSVVLKKFNGSSVDIWVYAWSLPENYFPVYCSINEAIYKSFVSSTQLVANQKREK